MPWRSSGRPSIEWRKASAAMQPARPTRSPEMNPFEMFKGMGQLASLMRNAPRTQEEFHQLQQRLGHLTAEGDAGAGMVKVKVNGRQEVLSCTLSEDALKLN